MGFEPEIVKGDPLYELIVGLVKEKKPKTILEIGSANGLGSTQAFLEGLGDRTDCKMFCIEADPERFIELKENVNSKRFVECINASSVPVDLYMSEKDIDAFMMSVGYMYNIRRFYNNGTIKKWRADEIKLIRDNEIPQNGISQVWFKSDYVSPDIVLMDGSAFSGEAELTRLFGSKIIIMDDIMDIKNHSPMRTMLEYCQEGHYKQLAIDTKYRNGFAAFEEV